MIFADENIPFVSFGDRDLRLPRFMKRREEAATNR